MPTRLPHDAATPSGPGRVGASQDCRAHPPPKPNPDTGTSAADDRVVSLATQPVAGVTRTLFSRPVMELKFS